MKTSLFVSLLLLVVYGSVAGMGWGCCRKPERIIVYAGKGLQIPLEEIRREFEEKYSIGVSIIYAGSETLLETIRKTGSGDVFIPGIASYLEDAGNLVLSRQYVAKHRLVFAARKDNPRNIATINDLLQPGIKIAAGNREMCAVGRISQGIFESMAESEGLIRNIAVTGTTVSELLDLVLEGEVDAAMVWADMMLWPEAEELTAIAIPAALHRPEEIYIAVLATTKNRRQAARFADFVARERRSVFVRHGFGE